MGAADVQTAYSISGVCLDGRGIPTVWIGVADVAIVRIRTNPDPDDLDVYYIFSSSPFFPDKINATHSKSVKLPSSRSHLFRHGYTATQSSYQFFPLLS